MTEFQKSLIVLLGMLRALKWIAWNGHWQVKGPSYYGDHLMMERLYTGVLDANIDTLAEKLVALYGSEVIDNPILLLTFNECVGEAKKPSTCPIRRALHLLQILQGQFNQAYKIGTGSGEITLGLDDFLMATANEHETFIYLLQQRLR